MILPPFLDNLSIQTNGIQQVLSSPKIGLKSIRSEDEQVYYSARIDHLSKECFNTAIIAVGNNIGDSQPGPDLDCYENPHRLLLCAGKSPDFISLKFN